MSNQLTPEQLSRLGSYIQQAFAEFPPKAARSTTIQLWECALENWVDYDKELPSYITLQRDHTKALAFLISYYAT